MKRRVCEVSLGRRGASSYGKGGRGMRSCGPTTSQILRPPWVGFSSLRGKRAVIWIESVVDHFGHMLNVVCVEKQHTSTYAMFVLAVVGEGRCVCVGCCGGGEMGLV